MLKELELLAPVGSVESLYAAIENGADAVYLGGKLFNARQYASNFDYDELKAAVEYAHLRDVKVYVVVNIILKDEELKEAIDYIIYLYNIDVDALIIQDLGLYRIIKTMLPDFEIHGSTQMSINNYMGASFLEEIGFKRAILARELSVEETKEISEKNNIELETFVHGALCVSYSGQCLMSSMIGGRSGNRGTCAQPCRMKYTIVDTKNNKSLNREFDEKHIMSLKDLNSIENLNDIIDAGVTSLKLEGRMKKPEYVSVIVNRYRKAIDNILGKKKKSITEKDQKDIAQMFNRGFTSGFLKRDFGRSIVSLDKPNNRGIYIGKVIKSDREFTYIKLEDSLKKGDGIEIVGKDGEGKGLIIDSITIDNKNIAKIRCIREAKSGDIVNKTLDIDLNEKARASFEKSKNNKKHPIYMEIEIKIGKPVCLKVLDNENQVIVKSEELAEKAMKVSLTEEKVRGQMEKLGDTPYILEKIEISLEDGVMVPVSVLNKLRREAISKLVEKRGNFNGRAIVKRSDLEEKIKELFNFPGKNENKSRKISVKVDNNGQFKELNLDKLDRVYLNFNEDIDDLVKEVKKYNKEIYISTEKIVENKEFNKLQEIFDKIIENIDGISVSNLGTLKFVKDRYDTNIHCDIGLNIFNTSTVKLLSENKVISSTLSPELRLSQIEKICRSDIMQYEVIGYGYLPVMIMKHCPMSVIKNCKSMKDCKNCNLREGYGLLDRKDMIFDFKRKENSTIIYNSQPIVIPEHLSKIYSSKVDMIRLDFTLEEEVKDIQAAYYDFANGKLDINEIERFVDKLKTKEGITNGHFFRGVL